MRLIATQFVFTAIVANLPMSAGTVGGMFLNSPTGTQDLILTIGGTPTTLAAVDAGWWDDTGDHTSTNRNYGVGDGNTTLDHNDFFVFDLSDITGTITAAQLSIGNAAVTGYTAGIPAGISVLSMYDVSTPVAALEATGSGMIGIFNDLGSGMLYALQTVSAADDGTQVLIPLDAAAVTALNSAEGGQFAIGGTLSVVTPEPSALALVGTFLAGLGVFMKLRKVSRPSVKNRRSFWLRKSICNIPSQNVPAHGTIASFPTSL
jgi:hypothetical protein